jgi:hypothetical protein
MQDIDFDELDRAVNSVTRPEAPEESRTSYIPVAARPASSSPAARRSSGRFMDVVHPSSDMRPQTSSDALPQPAPAAEAETPAEPTDSFQWPDPIELSGTHSEETPVEAEQPAEETPVQPLDSPFLPDAKVEKRPLGNPVASDFATNEESEEPVAETPAETKEDTPLPVELHEDIVKLEEAETPIEEPEATIPEFTPSTPVVEAPSGPTSITQQYKEQPSTAEQPSGAIYDTEAYHQALSHPEKKHSSILVIVWILALILVGGGMGAAVYFFVLPML